MWRAGSHSRADRVTSAKFYLGSKDWPVLPSARFRLMGSDFEGCENSSVLAADLLPHMLTMMLAGEHVAIELRHPLPTIHGQLKVVEGIQKRRRILFSHISGTDISQPLI